MGSFYFTALAVEDLSCHGIETFDLNSVAWNREKEGERAQEKRQKDGHTVHD